MIEYEQPTIFDLLVWGLFQIECRQNVYFDLNRSELSCNWFTCTQALKYFFLFCFKVKQNKNITIK